MEAPRRPWLRAVGRGNEARLAVASEVIVSALTEVAPPDPRLDFGSGEANPVAQGSEGCCGFGVPD